MDGRPHIRTKNTRSYFRPLRHSRGERFFVASVSCITGIIHGRFPSIKFGDRFFGCTNSVDTFIRGAFGSRTVFIYLRRANTACFFFDDCSTIVIGCSRFVSKLTTGSAVFIGSFFNRPQVVGTRHHALVGIGHSGWNIGTHCKRI
jgi:hypothetical protein